MKKLTLVSAIAISGLFFQTANAQIRVHLNLNLGSGPVVMAPAPVYHDDYYYLPDVEAYYSVRQQCYYYQDGGSWVNATYLPGRYRDYDWQHARRFAVNEPRPYMHNDAYRARYGGIQGRRDWGQRDDRNGGRVYADQQRFSHDNHDQNRDRFNGRNDNNDRGNNNNDRGGRGRF